MSAPSCPSPYSLTRVADGTASPEELSYVTAHTQRCDACRAELEALRDQGSAARFCASLGDGGPMPEPLWRAVAESLEPPPLRLRLNVAARGVVSRTEIGGFPPEPLDSGGWLELVSGTAELTPLMAGAMRGAEEATAAPLAGRLICGTREALIRRGPGRLTVVMTRQGQPAAGRRVRLAQGSSEWLEETDSAGVAIFQALPGGEYLLELEGMET